MPESLPPEYLPTPSNPAEREEHVLLLVRPRMSPSEYLDARAVGWILQLEALIADSEDEKFQRDTLKELLRFWQVNQPRESRESGQSPNLHLHKHEHEHRKRHPQSDEMPDLSEIAPEYMEELLRALASNMTSDVRADAANALPEPAPAVVPRAVECEYVEADLRAVPNEPDEEDT